MKAKVSTSTNKKFLKKTFIDKVEMVNLNAYRSQVFIGEPSDFIVLIKDSIHKKNSVPAAATAERYICYGEGPILDEFLQNGIKYEKDQVFLCNDFSTKKEREVRQT